MILLFGEGHLNVANQELTKRAESCTNQLDINLVFCQGDICAGGKRCWCCPFTNCCYNNKAFCDRNCRQAMHA